MTETPIRPDEWPLFCDRFTRKHRGWLVTLGNDEQADLAAGSSTRLGENSDKVPLQAVTFRQDGSGPSVAIVVGEKQDPQVHTVKNPVLLRLQGTKDGADRVLTIRSAEGEVVKVQFLTPHFGPAYSARREQRAAANSTPPDRERSVGRSVAGDRSRHSG